jgi:hypothetical protein
VARRRRRNVFVSLARSHRYRSPRRFISHQVATRGLYGESRGWRTMWYLVTIGGLVRRTFGRNPEVAAVEVLQPGEHLTLRTITPPTRKERRAAKRSP